MEMRQYVQCKSMHDGRALVLDVVAYEKLNVDILIRQSASAGVRFNTIAGSVCCVCCVCCTTELLQSESE